MGTVNFDTPPRRFTDILLITSYLQHFLTLVLCNNPCIIELIFFANKTPLKRRRGLRPLK